MKYFDYYSTVDVGHPDVRAVRAALVKKIEETPMTAAQRKEELGKVAAIARTIVGPEMDRYCDAQKAKVAEFWNHCRAELGYDKFLSADAVSALESYAYEHGHSSGFGEVYGYLMDLTELARRIAKGSRSFEVPR